MSEITDLTAARDAYAKAKQARQSPKPPFADPLLALEECVGRVVNGTIGLAETLTAGLAAVERTTDAHTAQIAALTTAVEALTRATVGAVAAILARLPPAPS